MSQDTAMLICSSRGASKTSLLTAFARRALLNPRLSSEVASWDVRELAALSRIVHRQVWDCTLERMVLSQLRYDALSAHKTTKTPGDPTVGVSEGGQDTGAGSEGGGDGGGGSDESGGDGDDEPDPPQPPGCHVQGGNRSDIPSIRSTIILAVISLILILLLVLLLTAPNRPKDLTDVSRALTEAQGALVDAEEYVRWQQAVVEELARQVTALAQEKRQIESLLAIERDKADDLLRFSAERQRRDIWVERAYGFVLGILSNLAVMAGVRMVSAWRTWIRRLRDWWIELPPRVWRV